MQQYQGRRLVGQRTNKMVFQPLPADIEEAGVGEKPHWLSSPASKARPGTHNHRVPDRLRSMGPRFREDDRMEGITASLPPAT